MKIALGFWGLARSLTRTLPSIQAKILDVLHRHGIEYSIFMHTFRLSSPFTNVRTGETNLMLNNEEYSLLKPDYVVCEDQDEVKRTLGLEQYRAHPDPWNTGYNSVDNFICAMHSKQKLTELIAAHASEFDYIIFLRPDVEYLTELDPAMFRLANDCTICVPNFHLVHGMNDRFAVTTNATYKLYGSIFHQLLPYSKVYPLHSETMYAYYMKLYGIRITYVPFYFDRIRADGSKAILDQDRRPFVIL